MIMAGKKKCNNCFWIGCTNKHLCPDCNKPIYDCDGKEYTGKLVHRVVKDKFGNVISEFGDPNKKVGIFT